MTVKPKHTNAPRYIREQMTKNKCKKIYSAIHIYQLIKQFEQGKYTQRNIETYQTWLEAKKKFSNWDKVAN